MNDGGAMTTKNTPLEGGNKQGGKNPIPQNPNGGETKTVKTPK